MKDRLFRPDRYSTPDDDAGVRAGDKVVGRSPEAQDARTNLGSGSQEQFQHSSELLEKSVGKETDLLPPRRLTREEINQQIEAFRLEYLNQSDLDKRSQIRAYLGSGTV